MHAPFQLKTRSSQTGTPAKKRDTSRRLEERSHETFPQNIAAWETLNDHWKTTGDSKDNNGKNASVKLSHNFNSMSLHAATPLIVQPKLSINTPGDEYEQEADAVADKIMRMNDNEVLKQPSKTSATTVQRKCAKCEKEDEEMKLQRKESNHSSQSFAPSIVHEVLNSSSGKPMDEGTRSFMESRFNHDFSSVKIYDSSAAAKSANSINALAYTSGKNIVFNDGKYSPHTESGKKLLAHELTHTLQQERPAHVNRQVDPQMAPADFSNVTSECKDALSKCNTVKSYCDEGFKTKQEKDELLQRYKDMVSSKSKSMPNAARNLQHFLNGSGSDLLLPEKYCKDEPSTRTVIDYHRGKFIAGAEKRLKAGKPPPFEMTFVSAGNGFGFTDFGLGVGGYTLGSKVSVNLVKTEKNTYEYKFDSWKLQMLDCYNWDPEKSVPFLADDKDACCVELFGNGKHFISYSPVWDNTISNSGFVIKFGKPIEDKSNPNEDQGGR